MTTQYVPLETMPLLPDTTLAHPKSMPELVYQDDPAAYVMMDFLYENPLVINITDKFVTIVAGMQAHNAHEALVLDKQNHVAGIVSMKDLQGSIPAKISRKKRLARDEITAKLLMMPNEQILNFDYATLLRARVGNVMASLRLHKKSYAFVIETNEHSPQIIRGLVSESKINEQLSDTTRS